LFERAGWIALAIWLSVFAAGVMFVVFIGLSMAADF